MSPRTPLNAVVTMLLAAAAAAAEPGAMEVLDEGRAAGRRSLRLALEEGAEFRALTTIETETTVRAGGAPLSSVTLPAIEMEQLCRVVSVDDERRARVDVRIGGCRVVPEADTPETVVRAMEKGLEGFDRLRCAITMNDRGVILEADVTIEGDAEQPPTLGQVAETMRQTMQQASAPLPEQPIGIGGRWRTRVETAVGGVVQQIEVTYEVTELTADHVSLVQETRQSAEPQAMKLPGIPPGTTARLLSLAGEGAGQIEMEFGQPLPVRMTTNLETEMRMRIESGDGRHELSQNVAVGLTMTGRPGAAEAGPKAEPARP